MLTFIKKKETSQSIRRYLELLEVLVGRNLKVRYRGSFLGAYWSLLNPLIMTGLYTAIFGSEFASYYRNSLINYMLAAFTGLVVINFFSASTTQALVSIVGNGGLLNKISLPTSIFPLSMVTANIVQFATGALPLLLIVTLINSWSVLNLIALFLPLFSLICVSLGVSFFISTLYVFFRDLPYFYELIIFVTFLSSPIFYPIEIVPDNIKSFLVINPISTIVETIRQIAISGNQPDIILLAKSLLSGLIVLPIGFFIFRAYEKEFMDLL